jgi:hypothetical protein
MAFMDHSTIDFGPFRLETGPDRLCRGTEEIALRPKGLGVLAYLARRPGRLVTKDELRESVVIYNGTEVYGVKWRDWKMMVKEIDTMFDLNAPTAIPAFYNLLQDPKEEHPVRLAPENLWIRYPASQVLIDHAASLKKEPPIPAGTPDPFTPQR